MYCMKMQTIKDDIRLEGVGLHSGKTVKLTIRPSDHGKIVFLSGGSRIEAVFRNVVDTTLAVSLGAEGRVISTVEHLLSALHAKGIGSAEIEVNGPEIPIFDGSAKIYIDAINSVGKERLDIDQVFFTVKKPLEIRAHDKYVLFLPGDKFQIKYTISFDHPLLDRITEEYAVTEDLFDKEIGISRTFTFLNVISDLKEKGLIKGGSFDNALVLDGNGIVNGEERIKNECLKHKVLDLLGDIYLLGLPFRGKIIAYKSGHHLNWRAAKTLAEAGKERPLRKPLFAARTAVHYDR